MSESTVMKIWLLRPRRDQNPHTNPWDPWFNRAFGFVVIAPTEQDARVLAMTQSGNEVMNQQFEEVLAPWLDAKFTTCEELAPEGPARVVIRDFARS